MAISLSPELLKSQAGQMEQLMIQYDSLFASVAGTLNSVNSNWSENLSNNFSSKITSAQKSFSGILDALQYGANAAKSSAISFEEIDTALSRGLGNGTMDLGSGSTGFGFGYGENFENPLSGTEIENLRDRLKKDWDQSQEAVQAAKEKYDSLPKCVQELIEKILEGIIGEEVCEKLQPIEKIKLILDLCAEDGEDLLALDVDPGIVSSIAKLLGVGATTSEKLGDKLLGSYEVNIIKEAYDAAVNPSGNLAELMRDIDYLQEMAIEQGRNGDIAGGLWTCVEATGLYAYTLIYGSYEVMTEALSSTIESKTELVLSIMETAGVLIPGDAGEVISDIAEGISTVIDGVNNLISGLFE